ncbi:MAG TPA: helix-turn-helix transcriptional regulator [Thermoanaerobaculia bacterium]|nr:helix-turn-helix transcriptional regulator [Thermoanaerobaculia bacterium]
MSQKPAPLLAVVLRNLRVRAGWTQVRLEREACFSKGSVCRLEKGDQMVDRFLLGRLAKVMGVAQGDLERAIAALEQLPAEPAMDGAADLPSRDRQIIETVSSRFSRTVREKARNRIEAKVRARRWRLDRAAAAIAWQRLRKMPSEDRKRIVEEIEAFHTWAVVERLCEESERAAANRLDEAREYAQLGRCAAVSANGAIEWRCWLEGYAAAFEANAWCAAGEFRRAETIFLEMDALIGVAAPPAEFPLDRTRPLLHRAVLLIYLEKLEPALAQLDKALATVPGPLPRTRVLICRAAVLKRKFQFQGALEALVEARQYAQIAGDVRLSWAIAFNEAAYLCEAGDASGAAARLEALQAAAFELGRTLDVVRLRWLTAKVAAASGRLLEASLALEEVWEAFAARRLWIDSALAVLELASIQLDRGQTREVKKLAVTSAHVFAAQPLPEKLLAAIRLFWDAAQREAASAQTAKQLIEELRRAGVATAEAP